MEEAIIVVMQKNTETGILEKEYDTYRIENTELLVNIFAVEKDSQFFAHLKLSTPEVSDWEFNAIFDYYDMDLFATELVSISEQENCFNPTWELVYHLPSNESEAASKLQRIVNIHNQEIEDVLEAIKDKKQEYES